MPDDGFYTLKGYQMQASGALTPAMEDYLEMVCRLSAGDTAVRLHALADALHVRPSSASKMVSQLKALGYLQFEKYGALCLTARGIQEGQYLIFRHETLHRFLCLVNHSQDELAQVEKIEHFFDRNTVYNIRRLLPLLAAVPPQA